VIPPGRTPCSPEGPASCDALSRAAHPRAGTRPVPTEVWHQPIVRANLVLAHRRARRITRRGAGSRMDTRSIPTNRTEGIRRPSAVNLHSGGPVPAAFPSSCRAGPCDRPRGRSAWTERAQPPRRANARSAPTMPVSDRRAGSARAGCCYGHRMTPGEKHPDG